MKLKKIFLDENFGFSHLNSKLLVSSVLTVKFPQDMEELNRQIEGLEGMNIWEREDTMER